MAVPPFPAQKGTNGCLVCTVRCHHMSCSWPIMHNKREREREENKEKKASLAPRQEPDPIVHIKEPVLRAILFQTDIPLSRGVQLCQWHSTEPFVYIWVEHHKYLLLHSPVVHNGVFLPQVLRFICRFHLHLEEFPYMFCKVLCFVRGCWVSPLFGT